MSENSDISSSASKSLLHEDVIDILNEGMTKGFKDGILNLGYANINDSMMPEICEWIIKLGDKVKILDLWDNQIASVDASMLFDILKTTNSSLKVIYMNRNKEIDDKCMKSLGEYIKSNKSIEAMSLSSTNISDAGIEILAPYLSGNTTFKRLHLSYNKGITDKSIPLLMKMIESSCIEDINIENTSITQKNIVYSLSICNPIKNGSTSLNLSENGINDDDLIKICDAMKIFRIDKLKEINLEHNNIKSREASVLFDTLKECHSVVSTLNLSYNQLDDECMKQLGEYLQSNEHPEELKLRNSKVTDKGIKVLSGYLIGNTTLKELDLSENKGITDASVPHLIEMVNKSCITKLDLNKTSTHMEQRHIIKEVLSIPINQRVIPIRSNTKSAAKIQFS